MQLEIGGSKHFKNILPFIQNDFNKICLYNYNKYKHGDSGLKRLQIEKEDFTAECYLVFFRRLSNKNKSMIRIIENPQAFLSNFVESRAKELIRRKSPVANDVREEHNSNSLHSIINQGSSPFIGASEHKSPEQIFDSVILQRKIFKAIKKLHRKDREILELRFIQEIKPKDIAISQDLDISKIYDRIKMAKKKLKENLKKQGIDYETIDLSI